MDGFLVTHFDVIDFAFLLVIAIITYLWALSTREEDDSV